MRRLITVLILAAALFGLGGYFLLWGAEDASPPQDEQAPEEAAPENPAFEPLRKCADTFYTQEKAKVTRIACFVQAPEIFKAQAYRSRYILEKVDYEMIWEQDKPLTVKPRDIPPYFGWEAKAEANLYAKLMATQLQEIFKTTNPVNEIIKLINNLHKAAQYEIVSYREGKQWKIEILPKVPERPKKPVHRDRDKEDADESQPQPPGSRSGFTLWLNPDCQITRLEILGLKEKAVVILTPAKYGKQWNIGQFDLTTYKVTWPEKAAESEKTPIEPQLDFKERVKIAFSYAHPVDKTMVISNIKLTKLDSDGKVLVRRNEVNPVNITFTKHEVEKSK